MARPPQPGPTKRELLLLKLLWEHGPLTVREIHQLFPSRSKPAYTSLQTNLQGMLEKAYIASNTKDRAHVYKAVLTREKIERETIKDVLERVFDGSALRLITTALTNSKASPEEIEKLQALIEEREKRD
jgi:BlaI family transcriptional regulator, penicillinase repressor